METSALNNSKLIRITSVLLVSAIGLTIMILAKSFLIPLAWSLVIALTSFRLLNRIEKKYHINRLISSLIFVALIFLAIIALFYFFYQEIASIINGIPSFTTDLTRAVQNMLNALEGYGIHITMKDGPQIHIWITSHMDIISKTLTGIGKSVGDIFLVGVYLFFMLYYRDNYLYYLRLREKTHDGFELTKKRIKEEISVISNFLYGLFITTVLMAVMLYVIFLLIGLNFALFFAILVALLSLLPYIGNPVGMIIVFVFALISNDGLLVPLLVLAGVTVTNVLKGNVIKPIIIGEKIDLNAFVIFLSVITGGLVWGVSGMILFMPFAGIVKVVLNYNESTKPLVALFTILPKDALNPSEKEDKENSTETIKK